MKADLEKLKYHLSLTIDSGGDPVYEQLSAIVEELEASRSYIGKLEYDQFMCRGCDGCANCQSLEMYRAVVQLDDNDLRQNNIRVVTDELFRKCFAIRHEYEHECHDGEPAEEHADRLLNAIEQAYDKIYLDTEPRN